MSDDNSPENDTNTGSPATEGAEPVSVNGRPRYWFWAAGGNNDDRWKEFYDAGIMAVGYDELDNLSIYHNRAEIQERLKEVHGENMKPKAITARAGMAWKFCYEVKPGDIVFAKNGARDTAEILGRGVVTGNYKFDDKRKYYLHTHEVDWKPFPGDKAIDLSFNIDRKALFKIVKEERIQELEALFNGITVTPDVPSANKDEADNQEETGDPKGYSMDKFLSEVYLGETEDDGREKYAMLKSLLETKKNIILQGPPGTGKTFAARRLAWSILGKKDDSKIEFVQFHQNYSYEDFMMGYKPKKTGDGFELTPGVFYDFCDKVKADPDSKYFFIIDEINRGNVSKIFGELLMLLESDHRKDEVKLAYKKEELFSLPENLYIIGMMNTADRSLAMLDYALRRRFGFFEMKPAFDTWGFRRYQEQLHDSNFYKLIGAIKELNNKIAGDKSLGEDFCIGHSYFCNWKECTVGKMRNVVCFDILPLLREYYFDNPTKRAERIGSLFSTGLLPREEEKKLKAQNANTLQVQETPAEEGASQS